MKNVYLTISLLGILFLLGSVAPISAQNKEFWFVVPDANRAHDDYPVFFMVTAGPKATKVTISMPQNMNSASNPAGFVTQSRELGAYETWPIKFDTSAEVDLLENSVEHSYAVTKKGILIKSDEAISAYYELNGYKGAQKEIFTLKGEKALGTEFYTPFQTVYKINGDVNYKSYRQIQIVAADDNTEVVFTPTGNVAIAGSTSFLPKGQAHSKVLNKGETLLIREHLKNTDGMLMGTHIVTKDAQNTGKKKKIAVTVYEDSVVSGGAADPIGDQIVPIDGVGTSYIVVKGYSVFNANIAGGIHANDHVYILATQPNTTVTMYTETSTGVMTPEVRTIGSAGGSTYFQIGDRNANPQYRVFESDKPVYCYHQSATGQEVGGALIPSMYSIASKDVTFYNQQLTSNAIFLIYREKAKDSFTLKFKDKAPQAWAPANPANIAQRFGGDWMYSKMPLSTGGEGVVTISNSKGAFALGYFASPGGTSLYGYLSAFGTFQFEGKPIHKVCGSEYVFDVGYAKSVQWTVPNPGDFTPAELKAETLTATKSGKYKVKIDLDMGAPIEDEVTLILQNLDSKDTFPKAAFAEEETTFKIKLNPNNDPNNVFNAQYKWTFEGGNPATITNEGSSSVEQVVKVRWNKDQIGKRKVKLELLNLDVGAGCTRTIDDFIIIHNYPDNVSSTECKMKAPKQKWTIIETIASDVIYDIGQPPLVGDVDGDGIPEILAYRTNVNPNVIDILASDGKTLKGQIETPPSYGGAVPLATMGKVKTNTIDTVVIVSLSSVTGYMYGSDRLGNRLWTSSVPFGPIGQAVTVSLADLDGDGWSELIVTNKVFAAESGLLLYEIPGGNQGLSHGWGTNIYQSGVGSVLNNGKQQIIAGNEIYDITINSRTDRSQNTHTTTSIARPVIGGDLVPKDGCAQAVDFDMDGNLDIVVSNILNNQNCYVYIWSPTKNEILASIKIDYVYKKSIPFIGDIDGDGVPEIVMIHGGKLNNEPSTNDKITALRYDGTNALKIFWQLDHKDTSGATAITLFDFDQNGRAELVYRDEKQLRIIDGSLKVKPYPYDLQAFPCGSATTFEYPIVADIDGDGQAEILTIGYPPQPSLSHDGKLRIYKSDPAEAAPWAPARKVWNQFAYNALNINEDLTVPRYPLSPATVFITEDGDEVRPYNAFLMQQTIMGKDGAPFIPLPNAQLKDKGNIEYVYDANTDKMTIKNVTIENNKVKTAELGAVGAAPLNATIYVTVYKENGGVKEKLVTYGHPTSIDVGSYATFDIVIGAFESKLPIDKILISINDDGVKNPYQPTCHTCNPNESGAFNGLKLDGIAWIDGGYRKCVGDKATFKSQTTLSGAEFTKKWFKPESDPVWKTGASTEITSLATSDVGQYTFEATNSTSKLSVTHVLPHLSVATKNMSWRSDAANKNWNDINNWNQMDPITGALTPLESVPTGCTTVHIPATATNYPSLEKNTIVADATNWAVYDQPTVGNIVYHYGSEVAYPHKLQYNKAYVQYNFGYYTTYTSGQPTKNAEAGGAVLKRDAWHPLAAPLKEMVSGDFAFAGYPFTWQAMPDILSGSNNVHSVDFDKFHGKNDQPLMNTYNMIAFKAPLWKSQKGYNDQKHIEALKGILEIPYFENEAQKGNHPSHSFDPISRTSSYYYYDNTTLQQLGSPVGTQKRKANDAYRFVFDKSITNVTIGGVSVPCYTLKVKPNSSKQVLIGNPFIASINMDNFKKANSANIDANTFNAYNSTNKAWTSYTYAASSVNPLQAFVVTLNKATEVILNFPLEGTHALTGMGGTKIPRRLETPGALSVIASKQAGSESDYAELSSAQGHTQTSNVSKLISQEGHAVPEAFFIDETGNNYNLIQIYNEGVSEVGLGVKCSDTESELTLSFDRIDEFCQINNAHPILVDKLLGVEQDLTTNSIYNFRQHTAANNQSQYADKKRFVIRFDGDKENSQYKNNDDLQVVYNNGHLSVKNVVNISEVEVYNLVGQLLFNSGSVNTADYQQNLPLADGGYIVRVATVNNKTISKKIIAK